MSAKICPICKIAKVPPGHGVCSHTCAGQSYVLSQNRKRLFRFSDNVDGEFTGVLVTTFANIEAALGKSFRMSTDGSTLTAFVSHELFEEVFTTPEFVETFEQLNLSHGFNPLNCLIQPKAVSR